MTGIKILAKLDEFNLPHFYLYAVNSANNKRTVPLKTVIDTGATDSFIQKSIAESIGLEQIGKSTVNRPVEGIVSTREYRATLAISDKYYLKNITMKEITQKNYPSDVLLGMNIIQYCDFYFSSKENIFQLIFHLAQ